MKPKPSNSKKRLIEEFEKETVGFLNTARGGVLYIASMTMGYPSESKISTEPSYRSRTE